MAKPLFYLHPRLDRAAEQRRDPEWLAGMPARPETRLVPVWRGKSFISGPRAAPRPVFPSAIKDWWPERGGGIARMGLVDGIVHLAVDVSPIAYRLAVLARGVRAERVNAGACLSCPAHCAATPPNNAR
jgi:hypothetical protein